MKLLIIGATGQLSQAFTPHQHSDVEILRLGRPQINLLSASQITNALHQIKPDLVINTAAYTNVDRAEQEPDLAYKLNADGAHNIAIETARLNCPLIQISTDYVFDGTACANYSEADATAPLNIYGASKLAGEQAVMATNSKHLIVRTSWIYSPFGRNFVKTMLRLAETRDSIAVVADQFGRPTSASDLAAALLHISKAVLAEQICEWGVYHLAGSGSTSWAKLASEVFSISQSLGGPNANVLPVKTIDLPSAARRPRRTVLDCSKAEAVFGVTLPSWQTGLKQSMNSLLGLSVYPQSKY